MTGEEGDGKVSDAADPLNLTQAVGNPEEGLCEEQPKSGGHGDLRS